MKICKSCKIVKADCDFHRAGQGQRKSHCKPCTLEFLKKSVTLRDRRIKKWRQQFGITENYYKTLLNSQENKCAICGIDKENTDRFLDVDHDHKSGKIRGLLCRFCNIGLGNFFDDTNRLQAAIQYLKERGNGQKTIKYTTTIQSDRSH